MVSLKQLNSITSGKLKMELIGNLLPMELGLLDQDTEL